MATVSSTTSTAASLASPGIGSNLDVNGIIDKLMSVEQQPLDQLKQQESTIQTKVSALGTLKSSLSSFQTSVQALSSSSAFQKATVTADDTTIATGSGGTGAVAGSYSLEVTKLAQAQKLIATGQTSTANTFSTGTISFDFGTISGGAFDSTTGKYTGASFTSSGSGTKTVTVDSSNNTLAGIRDAINSAKIGVTATIVNDGSNSPYRLVLTDNTSGKESSMKITVSDPGSLQDLLQHDPSDDNGQSLQETVTAQNADFKLDGISFSKASNTVTDAIAGVTLNLKKTNSGSPTTLNVNYDTDSVKSAINNFVKSYNDLRGKISSLTAYDATNKKASPLTGDATVRNLQFQLDSMLAAPITSSTNLFTQLSQIGVSKQKDGTLQVNSSKLDDAVNNNFSSIASLFAASAKPSDSLVSYVSSGTATAAGNYAVTVTSLATQGQLVGQGGTPASLTIDGSNNTLNVTVNGTAATITLDAGTYASLDDLATQVQSKINGANEFSSVGSSVTVSANGGTLAITSNTYGSASSVNITGGNGMTNLVGAGAMTTAGIDVQGTINGVAATGSGQNLTGATGDASEGLKIKISGGALGARGTVDFSKGYAKQIDNFISNLLDDDGALTTHTDELNASVKRLQDQEQNLNDRLSLVEQRYRTQFTALDTLMGSMSTTSSYLAQQLSKL